MFHFVWPQTALSVFHVTIGASDLQAAFEQFERDWWHENLGAIGVWQERALVARIRPAIDQATGKMAPVMQVLGI